MQRVLSVLISLSFLAMAGCVVAPYGRPYYGPRGYYYGPRVALVAPAPVVVVRP